jgi:hypothetical protein
MRDKECSDCLLKGKCVYSYVFETPPPPDTKIMRKYPAAPHPFVIEPPLERKRTYKPGDELVFGLTLVGRAIDYLPYFIFTFDELGRTGLGAGRGKFTLAKVTTCRSPVNGEKRAIYTADTKMLTEFATTELEFPAPPSDPGHLTLSFLTPTRIAYEGRLGLDLDFHILIRSLLRRLSLISYFHCNDRLLDLDFKALIEAAREVKAVERRLHWYDWERYSGRQDQRINMGGFVGKIAFEGPLGPFLPFIKAGEVLHVGKGTTFGLGRYKVRNGERNTVSNTFSLETASV